MAITIEAIYENGVLKLAHPLPLQEHEKVRVSVHTAADIQNSLDAVQRSHGLLSWTGDAETVRRVAEDPEFSILESP